MDWIARNFVLESGATIIIVIPAIGVRVNVPVRHSKRARVQRAREQGAQRTTKRTRARKPTQESNHESQAGIKEKSAGLSEKARAQCKRQAFKRLPIPALHEREKEGIRPGEHRAMPRHAERSLGPERQSSGREKGINTPPYCEIGDRGVS